MANSIVKTRTNYIKITDEEKFRNIMLRCVTDDNDVSVITHTDEENVERFGFYCDGNICGLRIPSDECNAENCLNCDHKDECNNDYEWDALLKELQTVIAPDDALIITTLSYEKLCYLEAYSEIVTHDSIKGITLSSLSLETAQKMLGNKDWTTRSDY